MAAEDAKCAEVAPATARPKLLVLTDADVRAALTPLQAVDVNAQAFIARAEGRVRQPERIIMPSDAKDGLSLFMPAHIRSSADDDTAGKLAVKVVSVRPGNAALGLPTVPATMIVLDEATAMPVAFLNATWLTALRTAAGSAACTRVITHSDASRLVVFGGGMQARAHALTMLAVRPLTSITFVTRSEQGGRAAVAWLQAAEEVDDAARERLALDSAVSSDDDAVAALLAAADIVVTATNSSTPLFDGSLLRKGTHVCAVGSYKRDMQELDSTTVCRARIIIDTDHAYASGDLAIPMEAAAVSEEEDVDGELGDLLLRGALRREAEDITLFKSVGAALQDVATARAVYEAAKSAALGLAAEL